MKTLSLCLVALFTFMVGNAFARDPGEEAKIQQLIAAVETLEGAQFLRNGSTHDAKEAADHLRLKLRTAGNRVKTADDFIRLCGSRSSLSGKPYQIRLADGTIIETEAFFRNRLKTVAPDKP
jgi:hypothetical protein